MKLATLKDGTRDGRLVIVSRDLARCVAVPEIARTMQAVLDEWDGTALALDALSAELNAGRLADADPFDPGAAMAPLPRAYQWADGSAYVNHVELVRRARGATMPPEFWTDPLMYQGGSDSLLGAHDDIVAADEAWGIDFEAEVAVVTGDVAMGVAPADAARVDPPADARQRRQPAQPDPGGARQGFRLPAIQARECLFAGGGHTRRAWRRVARRQVHLPLVSTLNGQVFGRPNAGVDMTFGFPQLIAHLARTRHVAAGSIVGSGTVSNKEGNGPGRPAAQGGAATRASPSSAWWKRSSRARPSRRSCASATASASTCRTGRGARCSVPSTSPCARPAAAASYRASRAPSATAHRCGPRRGSAGAPARTGDRRAG